MFWTGGAAISRKTRIIIIENDERARTAVSSVLEGAGYEVVGVGDAFEAIKHIYQAYPDLVIVSEDRLGISGKELCNRLRRLCYTPIVVLGTGGSEAALQILDSGADAYLFKDGDYRQLLARVRSLLRRKRIQGPKHIGGNGGGTQITEKTDGSDNLTPTEFRLLSYLRINEGRLVSHPQLTAVVWGEKRVNAGALKTCIQRLRQKLESFHQCRIVSCWGVGYRLDEVAVSPRAHKEVM